MYLRCFARTVCCAYLGQRDALLFWKRPILRCVFLQLCVRKFYYILDTFHVVDKTWKRKITTMMAGRGLQNYESLERRIKKHASKQTETSGRQWWRKKSWIIITDFFFYLRVFHHHNAPLPRIQIDQKWKNLVCLFWYYSLNFNQNNFKWSKYWWTGHNRMLMRGDQNP